MATDRHRPETTPTMTFAPPPGPPEQTDSEPPGPEFDAQLADVLALAVSAPLPDSLWPDVEERAVSARTSGSGPSLGPADTNDPITGYERAIAEIVALASTVAPGEWNLPAVNDWTVKGLFAHIAASERWFGWRSGLGGGDDDHERAQFGPDEGDHVAYTAPAMAALLSFEPVAIAREVAARGAAVADGLRRLAAPDWDRTFRFYAFDGPMAGNVIARTFELWTHQEDVLRALGRSLNAPDAGRLRMMSSVATALLGAGMQLAGLPVAGRSARIVLTGAGGGTFTASLDPDMPTAATDTLLIADVVDFCRVVARRLPIGELDMVVHGDRDLVHDLLVGASMLAAD